MNAMSETVLNHWWMLALRGVLAAVFGVLALAWPAITLLTLAALFGAFALLAGAAWTFCAVANRSHDRRWWVLLLFGLFSMAAGVLAVVNPALTILALVLVMGANALVSGVIDLAVAVRVRRYIKGEWLLAANGVIAIVFGVTVLLFPLGAGTLALAWMTGAYALLTGVLLMALAWQVRGWTRLNGGRSSPPAGAAHQAD